MALCISWVLDLQVELETRRTPVVTQFTWAVNAKTFLSREPSVGSLKLNFPFKRLVVFRCVVLQLGRVLIVSRKRCDLSSEDVFDQRNNTHSRKMDEEEKKTPLNNCVKQVAGLVWRNKLTVFLEAEHSLGEVHLLPLVNWSSTVCLNKFGQRDLLVRCTDYTAIYQIH